MNRFLVILNCLLVSRAICLGKTTETTIGKGEKGIKSKIDFSSIQGSWQGVSLEVAGRSAPKEFAEKGKYIFGKEIVIFYQGSEKLSQAKFIIDVSQDPEHIDLIGMTEREKGKKQLGIYKIENNILTLCISNKRPQKFKSGKTTGLAKFKRIKNK